MQKTYQDIATGLLFLVLGVASYLYALTIPRRMPVGIDSGFLPELVSLAIILVSLLYIGSAILLYRKETSRRTAARAATPQGGTEGKSQELSSSASEDNPKRLFIFAANFVLLVAYVGVLPLLGFILSTIPYLMMQIQLLGGEKKLKSLVFNAVFSVVTSVLIWMIFVKGFGLVLPSGLWE
ncbi:tripartite tricarboxylate transporter TctB family protein [uncultured Cohaesibacter sp.]|uniref:tripartite tricarboxylate transporter TctB family protein n=1 Tax=uncultured Cohaesibacter sp. TaxID=1002546 RepID=UPI00292F3250|nr:tripartite tricarboxylate transporter TctB family protein [uncultured Cohaesibacter sp.]